MACDSVLVGGEKVTIQKIFRLSDGRLAGISGTYGMGLRLIDRPTIDNSTHALILAADGSVTTIESELREFPLDTPAAIGSGSHLAIGAMLAGASARRAVEIACERDPWSGGAVMVYDATP